MRTIWLVVLVSLLSGMIGFGFGQSSEPYETVMAGDVALGYLVPLPPPNSGPVLVLDKALANAIAGQCKVQGERIVCADHVNEIEYLKNLKDTLPLCSETKRDPRLACTSMGPVE
ncbi:MAG TPA: hypothetical protein VEI01_26070 [Terriglobales bacterium]|nr:hypothetical protein [Terriglobales bacterium]